MKHLIKRTRTTINEGTVNLTAADVIRLLNEDTNALPKIPPHAEVTITVPGGADWSNERLSISDDVPLVIEWSTITEEQL